uniref:Neural cell adhesion molecule L1.1-like n=1 Tax=Pundamilia nyererei TaxID=303518 RepID=A0A3B4FBZ0_9CICH
TKRQCVCVCVCAGDRLCNYEMLEGVYISQLSLLAPHPMYLMHITRSDRVTMGLDGKLYFANLVKSDSREDYICHAQYREARTILPATAVSLSVKPSNSVAHGGKPEFFHHRNHSQISALKGNNITLECLPRGLPTPQVEWKKKDGVLADTTGQVINFDRWLHFDNITLDDDGEYECKASNTHGSITRSFTVTVEAAPYWMKEPQNLMYTPGETVRLDCQADGIPRPSITWRINGQLLTVDEEPRRTVTAGTLIMKDVNIGDTAVYQCEAKNDHGSILLNTYLYVVELPPQILSPDGFIYNATKGRDVALHCESFGSPRPPKPDPPSGLTLSNAEGVSVTLSWSPGLSHNSPITGTTHTHTQTKHIFSFTLLVPSINPTGVRSNSSEPGTLIITWDEIDKRFHNGQNFQYEVLWREADGSNVNWNSGRVRSPPFIVNNTGTYTPFEIKVRSVNALGGGPEPKSRNGHSGEDSTSSQSFIPVADFYRVLNFLISFSAVTLSKHIKCVHVSLCLLQIYYKRLAPKAERSRRSLRQSQHEEDRGERSKQLTEVTGLRLFSEYELTITAFNSKGESPRSPPHHFHTPEGVPGPPATLEFESPTEKSLILSWSHPAETNGILLGYIVQYQREVESKDSPVEILNVNDPTVKHITLDNLDPDSHYIFKVTACTKIGQGPPITRRGATLLDGEPPRNITVTSGNASVHLSWVPGERNRNHGFHIQYLKKSGGGGWEKSEQVNTTQGFYMLTGLQPGAQYHLRVMHGNSTYWQGEAKTVEPRKFATQGWLIGLISAIVLLVLILLILCLIKRSKGGKYAVKDKESKEVDSEARPMKDEAFGEYRSLESDGDEKRSDSQQSLEESKMGSVDSLAEYGDSVDIQFNEDGSFIGQYSGRASVPHGNESSGPASPVNAVPPPPVAPSMSRSGF